MTRHNVNKLRKNRAIRAIVREELSEAHKWIKACYWSSAVLKALAIALSLATIVYALFVSKDPVDLVYAIIPMLVFYGIGEIVATLYKTKLAGDYKCRVCEELILSKGKFTYSYHDVRLPNLDGRWSYEIHYDQITSAELSAKGRLITLHGLFQGCMIRDGNVSNVDTWSLVTIPEVFTIDLAALLKRSGVKTVKMEEKK